MLSPGIRLVERPGVLHFFDGRRVVSLHADAAGCAAIRAVLGLDDAPPNGTGAVADADRLLTQLSLQERGAAGSGHGPVAYAAAAAQGWVHSADAARTLAATTVHVLGDDCGGLRDELTRSGLRCRPLTAPAALATLDPTRDVVVAAATGERPGTALRAVNAACVDRGLTWLPISSFDGAVLRVGPLVVPGQTACYECAERRLAANVEYADLYRDVVADAPPAATPHALRSWAFALAALSMLHWIGARDARVPGRLLTLVPAGPEIRSALVYRVPRCDACAGPDYLTAAAPWETARDH